MSLFFRFEVARVRNVGSRAWWRQPARSRHAAMLAVIVVLVLLPPSMAMLAGQFWLLAASLPIVAGVATVRRHRALRAWQRELDLAFGVEERKNPALRPLL